MRSTWQRLALALAVVTVPVLAITGCSDKTGGTASGTGSVGASTAPSTAGSGSASTSASSAATPVTRPRQVDLKKITDPCALYTPQLKQAFGLDRPPLAGAASAMFGKGPACDDFNSSGTGAKDIGLSFAPVANQGIADWLKVNTPKDKTSVQAAGFPAIRYTTGQACFVQVDVADGQYLVVQFTDVSLKPDRATTPEERCQGAAKAAELVVASL
ncbi:DUF3558 domain-containing protein [Solihabitans fulvus]|uniref:DUF3558 domain-containing protein n=1 Tax=Solihabitans fulvus TaxID=1892852 RepID=A0A5B2X997_9PSEU|nr:DUF3558 domain-containing protein [Solihabitans fulvus]KAA2260128.1 DUF3558 domain-containing protein [Solihabitans fulvus]